MSRIHTNRAFKEHHPIRRLRDTLWPRLDEAALWSSERNQGWLGAPRPLPVLLHIMDTLSKGKPVSSTYLELWCRTQDDSFVITSKPREMALFSGFSGERAERTWISRMQILAQLGFIDIKQGPSGPISYALLLNPYQVIERHWNQGAVSDQLYNALRQRMNEVGARDLDNETMETRDNAYVRGERVIFD